MKQDAKKILKVVSMSLLFALILFYAFYRSKDLIFGVKITGVSLTDGAEVSNQVLEISGNARNAVDLTLDDREISIDQDGNFKENLALLPGYNIISIRAKDKFGHTDEKDYKITYKAQ